MATEHSQHMDVNGRPGLGGVGARVLDGGKRQTANNIVDSSTNTHRIDWQTPGGAAYTLTGGNVNNGEGYVAKLPQGQVIQPSKVPSGSHLWWAKAPKNCGAPPTTGYNLDIDLTALKDVPPATKVTLSFKSAWNIEWDFAYG